MARAGIIPFLLLGYLLSPSPAWPPRGSPQNRNPRCRGPFDESTGIRLRARRRELLRAGSCPTERRSPFARLHGAPGPRGSRGLSSPLELIPRLAKRTALPLGLRLFREAGRRPACPHRIMKGAACLAPCAPRAGPPCVPWPPESGHGDGVEPSAEGEGAPSPSWRSGLGTQGVHKASRPLGSMVALGGDPGARRATSNLVPCPPTVQPSRQFCLATGDFFSLWSFAGGPALLLSCKMALCCLVQPREPHPVWTI